MTNRTHHLAGAACLVLASLATGQPTGNGALTPPANGPRRADSTWVALFDCTAHPSPDTTLPHATVVFRAGKITALIPGEAGPDGKSGTDDDTPARLPLGPRIVRCEGLHVYPGLIEPFAEVDVGAPTADSRGQHWNPKVTPQRDAMDAGAVDQGLAGSLRKLGFTAAAIVPRGGVFRGSSAVVSLAKPPDEPSAEKPPVYASHTFQTVGFDIGGGYPSSLMGAIALVRQTFSDADWQTAERKRGALTGPDNCVDLLSSDKGSWYVFDCANELNALRAHKIGAEFSRNIVILGSGSEFARLAPIKEDGHRFILPLNFPKAPDVAGVGQTSGVELGSMMRWEQAPTNPRRMQQAGVDFVLTTHRLRDRNEFFGNLRLAIAAGYSESAALSALTTGPAQMLGVSSVMGTIDPGKIANLVVVDGPLFDRKTKFRAVWIDGREHSMYTAPTDIEGTWDITIPGAPEASRRMEIGKDNDVTLYRDDKSVKATKVTVNDGVISFTFDHEPLDGKTGIYMATAAITPDGAGRPVAITGQIARPDGSRSDLIATRRAPDLLAKFAGTYDLFQAGDTPRPFALVIKKVGEKEAEKTWKVYIRTMGDDGANADTEVSGVKAGDTTLSFDIAPAVLGRAPESTPPTVTLTLAKNKPIAGAANADGNTVELTIAKRERDTPTARGTWRVVGYEGKERPLNDADGLSIEITSDAVILTFTTPGKDPVVIKAENVKIDKGKVEFTHPLAPIGAGEGNSTDVITVEGDCFVGISTLPDGSKHVYRGWRKPEPKEPEKEDSLWRLEGVPEKLPVPFGPYGLLEQPKSGGTLVFEGVTAWTSGPEGIIENATVVVSDGKITYVGKGAPAGGISGDSIRIDGKGKHLTPGLIDAHSHTGISAGVNEGAQAVTSEVRIEDVTNPDAINWYRQLAGGITSVLNLHGSANAIGGQSQVNKLRWGAARPDDMHDANAIGGIKFALGENPTGKNGDGSNGGQYPITRMGVEMLIRDRFTAAKEYLARANDPSRRRDLELEALGEILEGKRLIHCHSYRQDEIVMLCRVAQDFGFKIGTFQHILEGYKVADYVRDYSGGGSGFADWWAYKVEVQDAIPYGLPLMHDVGVTVSFNSDSDEMARRMNVEAAKAVKYGGLSQEEALKFVTINPAKQLHVDRWVGSIETGKVADLALWNGSPLSAFSKCEGTWVDGVLRFSLDQDAKNRAWISAERQRLIQKLLAGNKKKDAKEPGTDAPRADGERRPPGAEGQGGGRRRRRPPETDDDARLERIRQSLLREFIEGRKTSTQGVCGCGMEHEAYRDQ